MYFDGHIKLGMWYLWLIIGFLCEALFVFCTLFADKLGLENICGL